MKEYTLSKQPYKGTEDWYPNEIYARNYLFEVWNRVAQRYGYEEYDTPLIEDANLYRAKSGEELGNNQLYSFTDKGGREIALRPELTPSLARMIASKRNELQMPLRWFNIGRYYRYEKPQKGRKREFSQLNIDILGISSPTAEVEIIQYVMAVLKELQAPQDTYELRINSRYLLEYLFDEILKVDEGVKSKLGRALDNYLKMPLNDFKEYLKELSLQDEQISKVLDYVNWDLQSLEKISNTSKAAKELLTLFNMLSTLSVDNVKFAPYIVRGLAYYTGTVIELYDTGKEGSNKALFGGGRYDNLLEIFGQSKIPAFGIGWGDTTTLEYMTRYNLVPNYINNTKVYVCLLDSTLYPQTNKLTMYLRENGINTLQEIAPQKLSKQLKYASKKNIPWVVIMGDDEIQKGVVQLKNMQSRASFLIKKEDIIQKISK